MPANTTNDDIGGSLGRLLTPDEVGDALGVSKRTVLHLVATGRIRAARLGHKTVRVPQSEVTRYLQTILAPAKASR